MSKLNAKEEALKIADSLCDNYSAAVLQQVASTLFQRTLDMKQKIKWTSSEDDLIRTFFYLTSKEELCESLQCDMESLYIRARHLGVVTPSFQTLTAYDLLHAVELFSAGKDQQEVLDLFGIESVSVPVKSLTIDDHSDIRDAIKFKDSSQMELF